LIYFLFFCSGLSGLIYQVVWVREFGNVFGNTIHSASLVVAVFMLGLGVGSYVSGIWADRRYAAWRAEAPLARRRARRGSLLRAYGYFELIIGALGLGVSLLLPHLDRLAALLSSYSRAPSGWYVLSTATYACRAAIAFILLSPITLLMGGTLTLLIRHLVRDDVAIGSRRIAILYAANTGGAALGCFLTDFLLVPAYGLQVTQFVAVVFNVVAGSGALLIADRGLLIADLKTARRKQSAIANPQSAILDPLWSPRRWP
jgi:spermidine synthase